MLWRWCWCWCCDVDFNVDNINVADVENDINVGVDVEVDVEVGDDIMLINVGDMDDVDDDHVYKVESDYDVDDYVILMLK